LVGYITRPARRSFKGRQDGLPVESAAISGQRLASIAPETVEVWIGLGEFDIDGLGIS